MKHLKIYENILTANSVRNMVKEYIQFIKKIEPSIIDKYKELAEDDDYEPNYGEKPFPDINYEFLSLESIGYTNDMLQFALHLYNDNGEITLSFYIEVTNDELKDMLIKLDTKKYNL